MVDGPRSLESAGCEILDRLGEQIELELEAAAQPQAVPGEPVERARRQARGSTGTGRPSGSSHEPSTHASPSSQGATVAVSGSSCRTMSG